MTRFFARILAIATAVGVLLPGASEAGKSLNHSQTLLRVGLGAIAAGVGTLLPAVSEAGRSLNHNQTTLRG